MNPQSPQPADQDISLCQNCHCMTHTVYKVGADATVAKADIRDHETYRTVCGKCGVHLEATKQLQDLRELNPTTKGQE